MKSHFWSYEAGQGPSKSYLYLRTDEDLTKEEAIERLMAHLREDVTANIRHEEFERPETE